MITTIILANVAVVFAFLAGAASDLSPLMARSEGKRKLFSALAIISLCMLVLVVARYRS